MSRITQPLKGAEVTEPVDLSTAEPAELTARHVLVDLPRASGRNLYANACVANRATDTANVGTLLARLVALEADKARLTDELAERDAKLEAQTEAMAELNDKYEASGYDRVRLKHHTKLLHKLFTQLTRLTGLEFGDLVINSGPRVSYVSIAGTWCFEVLPETATLVVSSTEDRDRLPLSLELSMQGLAAFRDMLALESYLSRPSRDDAKDTLPDRHFRQLFAIGTQGQSPDLGDESDPLRFMAEMMNVDHGGSFFDATPLVREKPGSAAAMIIAMAATWARVDLTQLRNEYGSRHD